MTNERAATATRRAGTEHSAMGYAGVLDPDVRRFIGAIADSMARHPDADRAPLAEQRAWTAEARAPWAKGGPAMVETQDRAAPTRHGMVRLRIHRPHRGELPGLVYLHGGGWTLFSIDTHDRLMREYADRAGCCVIGVDYALSPEHKFPVALEQVVDVVGWLVDQGRSLGIDPHRLAIGGDSAGANLSVAASLLRRDERRAPPLCGMLLNYGAYTSRCSFDACRRYGGPEYMLGCDEMDGYWRNYVHGNADLGNPLVCPLLAAAAGLPPAFFATAECDVLAEQGLQMAGRLLSAGVPVRSNVYAGASHSFLEAVSVAAIADRALTDAAGWLGEAFGPPVTGSCPNGVA